VTMLYPLKRSDGRTSHLCHAIAKAERLRITEQHQRRR
jgi:hypothetical protein